MLSYFSQRESATRLGNNYREVPAKVLMTPFPPYFARSGSFTFFISSSHS